MPFSADGPLAVSIAGPAGSHSRSLPGNGWATDFELEGTSFVNGESLKLAYSAMHRATRTCSKMHKASPALVSPVMDSTPPSAPPTLAKPDSATTSAVPATSVSTAVSPSLWNFNESKMLKFSWEVFNVTNSVRFDAAGSLGNQDLVDITGFGKFNQELTTPRVMQFARRFAFLTKVKVRIRISSKRKEDGTSRPFLGSSAGVPAVACVSPTQRGAGEKQEIQSRMWF